jgi:biopolymer transport protein ExbD
MPKLPPEEKMPESNMTPMIDVVFQLLIFFMLSMHFKEIEGKLLSTLPKDKGLQSSAVLQPELQEIRIVLCADSQNVAGGTNRHVHDKGRHETEQSRKDPKVFKVLVEKIEMPDLYMTEHHGGKLKDNQSCYKQIASKVKELVAMTPSSRDTAKKAPVILDADTEVPYEHIIGVVNACKEVDIDNVEFVGNPRFDKYYGSGQKGQFQYKK